MALKCFELILILSVGTGVFCQGGFHIDLPGQAGNFVPVSLARRRGSSLGSHVDLPGQHGNLEPVPVVHRTNGASVHSAGGSHVDLPGEHGNLEPVQVIHRDGAIPAGGAGGSHVDLPGQHGNLEPVPVIHREHEVHKTGGGSHVDLPGQHGNLEPVPVIHREGPANVGAGGTHVDLPGEHGNIETVPVVHREGGIPVHRVVELTPGIGSLYPPGRGILIDRHFGDPHAFGYPGYRGRSIIGLSPEQRLMRRRMHRLHPAGPLVGGGGGLAQFLANTVLSGLG